MTQMKRKRIEMNIARDVVRLIITTDLSNREIANRCQVSHVSVATYRKHLAQTKIKPDELKSMSDSELQAILKAKRGRKQQENRPQLDFETIHLELKKKGVTLQLLWEEYIQDNPAGYKRAQFCKLYKRWRDLLNVSMRQVHKAGEKLFLDYSGLTMKVKNSKTGEERKAEIFVAILGASQYIYAEASWDQSLRSWIRSHINAFNFYGGVAEILVPDNLKSAVTKASPFDPEINQTYQEMSRHYGTTVVPARVRKPKDKGLVENAVKIVQNRILGKLRKREFFALEELNKEIFRHLDILNKQGFQKMKGTRHELFLSLDQPALLPLPIDIYDYAEWKRFKVALDYHVEVNGHLYSVPHKLVGQSVQLRISTKTVEIIHGNQRKASHLRDDSRGKSTIPDHMPPHHQKYASWSPEDALKEAIKFGDSTVRVMNEIIKKGKNIDLIYRNCHGLLHLGSHYRVGRLESACKRAIRIGSFSYQSIKSILENGLDQAEVEVPEPTKEISHPNIRGKKSYAMLREITLKSGDMPC